MSQVDGRVLRSKKSQNIILESIINLIHKGNFYPTADEVARESGIAIRMQVEDLRVMGRATQGVKVISLKDGDSIAAVAKVMKDDDDIEDINEIEFTGDTV